MMYILKNLTSSAIIGLVLCAVLAATATEASASITANYFFEVDEDYNAPSLNRDGITVTGSGNVTLYRFGALGIAGGNYNRVDGLNGNQEYVDFAFNSGAATDVSWTISAASLGETFLGEATVEAWDEEGTYLGSGLTSATAGIKTLDIYFGGDTQYSRFRLTSAPNGSFAVGSVTYVPEPAALASLALLSLATLGRRPGHRDR